MKKSHYLLATTLTLMPLLTIANVSIANNASTIHQDIDNLTQTWLTTEQSTSKLKADWRLEKQLLSQRISLLKKQNQQLTKQVNKTNTHADELTLRRQELLLKQGDVEQSISQYKQVKSIFTHVLQQRIASAPPYLQHQLNTMLASISISAPLNKQYQVLVDTLKQWHKNDQLLNVKQGMILIDGQELMTEQFYLGNDQAWFTTPDNSRVGVGFPHSNGWQWQLFSSEQTDTFARAIKRAINDATHQTPSSLIELPVNILHAEHTDNAPINAEAK
jgi:hypothetical protein|tara:strand:+ start:1637 stop:2461 length:825 start_codon:yes stop_codon:yes gene_type:complete